MAANTSAGVSTSDPDLSSIIGNLLGQGAVTANGIVGNNSAISAVTGGLQNGINTLGTVQGQNANSLASTANTNAGVLAPAAATGAGASGNLATYLGLNGQPADFSQFYNTPGYQFALQQGTRAINSQAAASGSAFTPNTLAAVGNYVQGAASTNYNNYINQLLQTQGQGITAQQGIVGSNTGLAEAGVNSNLSTGSSIAQLQGAQGAANGTGAANQTNVIGTALGALGGAGGISSLLTNLLGGNSPGGANASGVSGALGGLGKVLNGAFGGTGTPGSMTQAQLDNLTGGTAITNNSQYDTDTSLSNDQLAALYGFGPTNTNDAQSPSDLTSFDELGSQY